MAVKKMKKAAMKKTESSMMAKKAEPCCACSAPTKGLPHIQDWLIILLGALGLATSMGLVDWPGFGSYFPSVWSVLVIVIGATNLMNKNRC